MLTENSYFSWLKDKYSFQVWVYYRMVVSLDGLSRKIELLEMSHFQVDTYTHVKFTVKKI